MTETPQAWREAPREEMPQPGTGRWSRFKAAMLAEIRWKPEKTWPELQRILLFGVPLLWFVSAISVAVGHLLGFRLGTDGQRVTEMLHSHPLAAFLMGAFVAPLLEEFFFRVLPRAIGKVVYPAASTMWPLAVVVTTVFALAHINPEHPTFPLPQFLVGLVFWAMQIRFGLRGSVAMHACFNGSIFLLLLFGQSMAH